MVNPGDSENFRKIAESVAILAPEAYYAFMRHSPALMEDINKPPSSDAVLFKDGKPNMP